MTDMSVDDSTFKTVPFSTRLDCMLMSEERVFRLYPVVPLTHIDKRCGNILLDHFRYKRQNVKSQLSHPKKEPNP